MLSWRETSIPSHIILISLWFSFCFEPGFRHVIASLPQQVVFSPSIRNETSYVAVRRNIVLSLTLLLFLIPLEVVESSVGATPEKSTVIQKRVFFRFVPKRVPKTRSSDFQCCCYEYLGHSSNRKGCNFGGAWAHTVRGLPPTFTLKLDTCDEMLTCSDTSQIHD